MIKETYCSFEVSKLLKEKGFDVRCRKGYWYDKQLCLQPCSNNIDAPVYACPTQSLAMLWLREVHHKIIIINYGNVGYPDEPKLQWHWELLNIKGEFCECNISDGNETYEEAVEAALLYILKNLI